MRIKQITSQHRRDFYAVYECEWCGHTFKASGYDDRHYHENVVPGMTCSECGKGRHPTYRALTTRYPEGHQV